MSAGRFRRLLLLALLALAAWWIYKTRPSVSEFVDDVTRPLLGSRAAVEESEHNRVVGEVAPAVGQDETIAMGMLHEGMSMDEVRGLIGPPGRAEEFLDQEIPKIRWIYRRLGRVVVFRDGRVVSIEVR